MIIWWKEQYDEYNFNTVCRFLLNIFRNNKSAFICFYQGDRMWAFAVGLYLVELTPGSLMLTAIYSLVVLLTLILFGPFVGDWVDKNPRLRGMSKKTPRAAAGH